MAVEELVVTLGLDASGFAASAQQAFAVLDSALRDIAAFMEGVRQGLSGAFDSLRDGAESAGAAIDAVDDSGALPNVETEAAKTATAVEAVAAAAQKAGGALGVSGKRGADVMQEVRRQAVQTNSIIQQGAAGITQVGQRWGMMLRGIITRFAAPVLGACATGSMVNSYFSGVAQVAQMTGRYSTRLEEWRKKRELLSRVTKEDIELYRKGKLALLNFNFAMASLSTTIMRALRPAFDIAVRALSGFSDWIKANENNILRFLKAIAIVVGTALIPAFVRWGAVMLANPITWIIAAVAALAFVLDDLMTYISGGRSLLAGFWGQFGTGAEVAEKLGQAWENLKRLGVALFNALKTVVSGFVEYFGPAFGGLADVITNFIRLFASLLEGDFSGALEAAKGLLSGFADFFGGIFNGLAQLASDALGAIGSAISNVFNGLGDLVQNALNAILDTVAGWARSLLDYIPDFLKSDDMVQWQNNVDAQIKQGAADATGGGGAADGGYDWSAIVANVDQATAAALPAASQSNNVENNANINSIVINTQATDADSIFKSAADAVQSNFSFPTAAADGGVR